MLSCVLGIQAAHAGNDGRPNILLLMAEDMSSRVGAFGDNVAVTPVLDELARQGVRYTNTFTTAGVCAPSRAAHILGMHQVAFGAQHMRTSAFRESAYRSVPPPQAKAYPELLRRTGYYTFTNRKLDYQFSSYAPGSGPFTIWDKEDAEADWSGRDPGQPFFGLVNFPGTHESQLFDRNYRENLAHGLQEVVAPVDVVVPPYYPDTAVVREYIARQYNNIHAMDNWVAGILERLEEEGLAKDTIVIWTTDHGDGLPRAKREIYDSGIHVPMIVRWPVAWRPASADPGSIDDRLISFVDLGPSVLALAGAPVPDWMHGRATLLDDTEAREYLYAAKDRMDQHSFRERAVRDKRFKYIRNFAPGVPGGRHIVYRDQLGIMQALWEGLEAGSLDDAQLHWFRPQPAELLFDTARDPHELRNLADDPQYRETLQRLRGHLDARLVEVGDMSVVPELVLARGFWPGGEQPVTPPPVVSRDADGRLRVEATADGASSGYRIDDGRWRLFDPDRPPVVPAGTDVTVKSVRYGWQASEAVTLH